MTKGKGSKQVVALVHASLRLSRYRQALGIEKALAEIERGRGSFYDAQVVDACLTLFRDKGYTIPACPFAQHQGPP